MNKNKISEKKLFMMLSIELFAMTSLILPAVLVGFAGKGGLPVLLASSGLLFLLAVWYLNCYSKRKSSPDHLTREERNPVLRGGIRTIYVIRFFIHGLFLMILFVNLIREVLLPDDTLVWIMIPILGLVYLTAGKQFRIRGRILEVLFPYIFVPLLIVLFLALFQIDYEALPEQLWGTFADQAVMKKAYGIYGILLFYQPIEFILFLCPALQSERKESVAAARTIGAACIFTILMNVILYIGTIGMFGTVRTGEKLWSALYIMQSVRLPGRFVERLDILFLVFWIFSAFALVTAYLYYGSRFVQKEKWRWYTVGWIAGIFIMILWIQEPEPIFQFFIPYKMWVDFPLSLLLPAYLYRKKGKKTRKKGTMAALVTTICLLTLTGCHDWADIEDKNYVMSMGVEKGENSTYKILYETADLSSGDKEGGRKGKVLSYEADSLQEAEEMDYVREDKKLDFGHLKAILFSVDMMNDEKVRSRLLEELNQRDSIAGTTLVFYTEEEVGETIELGGEKGPSFGEYVDKMAANQNFSSETEDTLAKLLRNEAEGRKDRRRLSLKIEGEQIEIKEESQESGSDLRSVKENVPDIVRFHIRADSDLPEDQERKIRIKDRILPKLQELLDGVDSKDACMSTLKLSLDQINDWVQTACEEEKYVCESRTYLCRESFPLKIYGDILLPSGTYDALRIDLGKAEGANWWCMMYPSLCYEDMMGEVKDEEESFRSEEESGSETLSGKEEKSDRLAEEKDGIWLVKRKNPYQIRWKIAEWLESLKTSLEKIVQ